MEVHSTAFNRNRPEQPVAIGPIDENATKKNESEDPANRVKEVTAATGAKRKICLRTPTDFSETETSSSGYSDEISSKSTQTEETFLCTIADGDDKFSIYDEASPIDSRFRHCPKYRHLFKEIFATLKKAAENKDDGEKLPLLDDTNPSFKVPPVTPATEELPSFPDDTESIASSVVSEQSVAMSERVTKLERKSIKKNLDKTGQENLPPTKKEMLENGRVLTPFKREPLEFLAFSNIRKKNNKKRANKGRNPVDPCDIPPAIPSPPRFFYANVKQKRRSATHSPRRGAGIVGTESVWNGDSITVYNRNLQSPVSNRQPGTSKEEEGEVSQKVYRTKSSASHDLHKLMKLDLSYAEVLRRADQCKHHRRK